MWFDKNKYPSASRRRPTINPEKLPTNIDEQDKTGTAASIMADPDFPDPDFPDLNFPFLTQALHRHFVDTNGRDDFDCDVLWYCFYFLVDCDDKDFINF